MNYPAASSGVSRAISKSYRPKGRGINPCRIKYWYMLGRYVTLWQQLLCQYNVAVI